MIYEILYIIPAKYSEKEIPGITDSVDKLFEKHGAKSEKKQNLGKIKFAYPIKRVTHGTYILNYLTVDGEMVKKIDEELRLADEVLRHIIVKREDIPEYDIVLTEYKAPLASSGKRVKQPKAAEPMSEQIAEEETASVEDLHAKVDEMLEDDKVEGEE